MKTFRNGVSHYTVGTLKAEVNFPKTMCAAVGVTIWTK